MAEAVVWNRKLLVASLALGVAAVVLFYAYEALKTARAEESTKTVLTWKRDGKAGQEVAETDIGSVKIALTQYQGLLAKPIEDNPTNRRTVVGSRLTRDVSSGDYVRPADVVGAALEVPSKRIRTGMRAFPLKVDPERTTGNLLSVDDRIDLIGILQIGKEQARAYTLIENLRVLAIGGKSQSPEEEFRMSSGRSIVPGMRVYRTITVEVTPDTAERLAELLPRVQGRITVVVRRRGDEPPSKDRDGRIPEEILPILKQPLPTTEVGDFLR